MVKCPSQVSVKGIDVGITKVLLSVCVGLIASTAAASTVVVNISNVTSAYPQKDTLSLVFDDSAGAVEVPYWLNGFVTGNATVGYIGTLHSAISSYEAPIYIAFTPTYDFRIFQECSLVVKCYLALSTATNGVPSTINPLLPGNLAGYLQENLDNLTTFAGPNAGWNVSYNTLPSFPETFPWLQVVKPIDIAVSPVPEPSSLLLAAIGSLFFLSCNFCKRARIGA